jgi:hypothetical protein
VHSLLTPLYSPHTSAPPPPPLARLVPRVFKAHTRFRQGSLASRAAAASAVAAAIASGQVTV